jgi:hypothetical protein
MSPRVLLLLFGIVLSGAIWAMRPMDPSPFISAARAQTPADSPYSNKDSLAEEPSLEKLALRHTVFVPAYSTIRLGSGKGIVQLATTLSIQNTSEENSLILLRVDYIGTAGNLLHRFLERPIAIRSLGSVQAFVAAEDTRGGTGANFIVEWATNGKMTEPLVEAVMVGTNGAQGFSFTSRGQTRTLAAP